MPLRLRWALQLARLPNPKINRAMEGHSRLESATDVGASLGERIAGPPHLHDSSSHDLVARIDHTYVEHGTPGHVDSDRTQVGSDIDLDGRALPEILLPRKHDEPVLARQHVPERNPTSGMRCSGALRRPVLGATYEVILDRNAAAVQLLQGPPVDSLP